MSAFSLEAMTKSTKEELKALKEEAIAEWDASALKEMDLLTSKTSSGEKPTLNTENICRVLRKHWRFSSRFRYDDFRSLFEIKHYDRARRPGWQPLEDSDILDTQSTIASTLDFFQKVGKDMVYDAIIKVSKENTYDSARDYIKSIKWDEIPRLSSWLTHTYGTPDDIYHQAVGSNWLKGLVKRICEPGCKFDYVLVLEGEQGVRKSTSLAVLGGDWHVETTMSTDNKDFFMQFQGKAIIEFSEGETLNRTEVKRMKAIITMQSDKYRPPYGRVSVDFPRRCVFAMTTNQAEYLKDETGNRRWLPVAVCLPQANTEWLQENREQLLAEAYHRIFTLKETIHEFPVKETLQAQDERRIKDPNMELIATWYMTELDQKARDEGITIDQVFKHAINGGFGGRGKNKVEEMSIANVLRNDLGLTKRQTMKDGVRIRRWFSDPLKDMTISVAEEENARNF